MLVNIMPDIEYLPQLQSNVVFKVVGYLWVFHVGPYNYNTYVCTSYA